MTLCLGVWQNKTGQRKTNLQIQQFSWDCASPASITEVLLCYFVSYLHDQHYKVSVEPV